MPLFLWRNQRDCDQRRQDLFGQIFPRRDNNKLFLLSLLPLHGAQMDALTNKTADI
jgi:hypothetical protein